MSDLSSCCLCSDFSYNHNLLLISPVAAIFVQRWLAIKIVKFINLTKIKHLDVKIHIVFFFKIKPTISFLRCITQLYNWIIPWSSQFIVCVSIYHIQQYLQKMWWWGGITSTSVLINRPLEQKLMCSGGGGARSPMTHSYWAVNDHTCSLEVWS